LSDAEIINLSTRLENDAFGGLTGGQEAIATLLGGGYVHIWLRGFHDRQGPFPDGFLSIPLPRACLEAFAQRAVLLQAGKVYENGEAVQPRFSKLTNFAWADGLEDGDSVIVGYHQDNVRLTMAYVQALRESRWDAVAEILNQYVHNRDANTFWWMKIILDW